MYKYLLKRDWKKIQESHSLDKKKEYIGFWVSKDVLRPLSSKLESIKSIDVLTKVRNVRRFVGIINFYRDMWRNHAHTLAPVTKLCSTKVKFKWTDLENSGFISTKKIVGYDVLLSYLHFSERNIIHNDARKNAAQGVN